MSTNQTPEKPEQTQNTQGSDKPFPGLENVRVGEIILHPDDGPCRVILVNGVKQLEMVRGTSKP